MLDCFQVHLGTAATATQTLNIRFSANLIVWPALLIIIAIITTDYNSNSEQSKNLTNDDYEKTKNSKLK